MTISAALIRWWCMQVRARYRALRAAWAEWRIGYIAVLNRERARLIFLDYLRDGYTPEQIFKLATQGVDMQPGSPEWVNQGGMMFGFAQDAGVAWDAMLQKSDGH